MRTLVLAACAALLVPNAADARRRTPRPPSAPPPVAAPSRQYPSPDDLPEPQRSTYEVLHVYGKA